MSDKTWKRRERDIAKRFGTKRTGPLGYDENDIEHPLLAIEVKSRKQLPMWALECLEQARSARRSQGKTPMTIMIGERMRLADGLVVLTLKDFEDLFGKILGDKMF